MAPLGSTPACTAARPVVPKANARCLQRLRTPACQAPSILIARCGAGLCHRRLRARRAGAAHLPAGRPPPGAEPVIRQEHGPVRPARRLLLHRVRLPQRSQGGGEPDEGTGVARRRMLHGAPRRMLHGAPRRMPGHTRHAAAPHRVNWVLMQSQMGVCTETGCTRKRRQRGCSLAARLQLPCASPPAGCCAAVRLKSLAGPCPRSSCRRWLAPCTPTRRCTAPCWCTRSCLTPFSSGSGAQGAGAACARKNACGAHAHPYACTLCARNAAAATAAAAAAALPDALHLRPLRRFGEVKLMADRIISMRTLLRENLEQLGNPLRCDRLEAAPLQGAGISWGRPLCVADGT